MQTIQTTAIIDHFGRPVPVLSPDEQAVLQSVLRDVSASKRGVLSLDMRNSDHRRFVLDRFGGDDYLERYFPTSRNLVETTRVAHEAEGGPSVLTLLEMDDPAINAWHPLVNITYLGLKPDGRTVIAQGMVTLPAMASTIASNLILTDNVTQQQFASVTIPTQYNVATQVVEITGTVPNADAGVNITATLTTQILPAGAVNARQVVAVAHLVGSVRSATDAARATLGEEEAATPVQSVTVINPNHNAHPTLDYIKVGLNRTPQDRGDCDYYYQYGVDGSKPIVGLQVNGSALLVSGYTVAQPPNFNGSCILMRRSNVGDGATLAFPANQIPPLCNGAGGAVSWNIGPDWFQGAPWDQGQAIDLDFTLNFSVTPGGSATLRVTSVPQAVQTLPTNLATIAPIQFVWGCVASGTAVRMADGTMRRIETLRIGERVADGRGGSSRIAEVWTGHEAKPLYRLATASGAEVLVTDEHPVPTAAGVKLARDLLPGMVVTTLEGAEALLTVEAVSYDGPVVNLDLLTDDAATLSDIDDDAITAFEAGGILIGDNRMQGVWAKRARSAAADPLDTLGPEWRLDITNSRRLAIGLPPIERIAA
jgi:hypothetical protein